MTPSDPEAPARAKVEEAALDLICRAEAGWQAAPLDQLVDWQHRLSKGLSGLRAAHGRTVLAVDGGTIKAAQPAVLAAYLQIAPGMIGRLEDLLANIAARLDALAPTT